jgi:hypothetical protein
MTSKCKYMNFNEKMPTSVNIFSGKDAALEAAYEELRALKEITSFDVSTGILETDYKIHLEEYHKRVGWHHCHHIFGGVLYIMLFHLHDRLTDVM